MVFTAGLPRTRQIGGHRRPILLSSWLYNQLSGGAEFKGQKLYAEYKKAMWSFPLVRKRGKRKVVSYNGFMHYVYILRRLGLIEYMRDAAGNIIEEEAKDKGGSPAPQLARVRYFRAVPDKLGDPAWEGIREAYRTRWL